MLRNDVRSDPVLLRLALAEAAARQGAAPSAVDTAELRARMAQAALRPDAATTHAREQAMFALFVDADAQRALQLARTNVELQREPIDLLLLAQAARAAGNDADRCSRRARSATTWDCAMHASMPCSEPRRSSQPGHQLALVAAAGRHMRYCIAGAGTAVPGHTRPAMPI